MNIYQEITDRIIHQLEQGVIPWERPWTGVMDGAFNRVSKKPYSILNQMMLKHRGEYASFKQWKDLGGKIKKGEKSEMVVFWKITAVKEKNSKGEEEIKQIPILRYYNVFHISQVEGVEPLPQEELNPLEPIEECERIKEEYKKANNIKILELITNRAFYRPFSDLIEVPCKDQYKNISEFYSTLFHEMIHSTGHYTRLNRFDENAKIAPFGSEDYSKEELVAEIGAATLVNITGIETEKTFRNSTAYIQSWLGVLKNDNKFIVSASGRAEKAVKYILGERE